MFQRVTDGGTVGNVTATVSAPENRIWWVVVATVADRLITLPYFSHEGNPVTAALGPAAWIIVTIALLAVGVWVWYECELWRSRAAVFTMNALAWVTAVIIARNAVIVSTL